MNEGRQPEDESAKLDFKSVHIDKEWKHDAPLIGCRFDPSGRFVFQLPWIRTYNGGTWKTDRRLR